MRKRLIFSTAVLACAGVVAMLADGTTVGASGAVPVESAYRMPSGNRRRSGSRVEPDLERHRSGFGAGPEFAGDQPLGGTRRGCRLRCRQRGRQAVQAVPRHGPCTVTHVGTSRCDPSVVRDVDQALPGARRPFDDAS